VANETGLTDTGLVIPAIADIRADFEADLREAFYAALPLGDKTLLGHIIGMLSNALGLLWERLEQVNSSQDPDKATKAALDALAVLTGTFRQPATKSYATLTLCGDDGTTVNAGSIVQSASSLSLWDTRDTKTTALLTAWAPTTLYAIDARVSNSSRCYQCIATGTSAGSGGPITTAADITDGTAHWAYLGEGLAAVDVFADCEVTGPVQGTANDLTAIQTPVAGWSSARNITDAIVGSDESTDEELRLIRKIELAGSGATTRDALRAALQKLANVTSVEVFTNRTDVTNGDGLPPHSFEALVLGGDAQSIVDTIADNQPDGIATYSSSGTFGSHTDSEGNVETIYYTRPTSINVYADVTLEYDATYPTDGDTQVATAIALWGQQFIPGQNVTPSAVGAQAFKVSGVTAVPQVLVYTDVIGTPAAWASTTGYVATVGAPSVVTNDARTYVCITTGTSAGSGGPTGTGTDIVDGTAHWRYLGNPILIAARQLASFDSTRIHVHSTPAAP